MKSLLGQFYYKIKGSQEDIASESLVYILKQSVESRNVINQLIESKTNLAFSDLRFSTQNTGESLERPDISGRDDSGKEVLLIEAKFWASLTQNQPNGYLKRLKDDTVLIFLVPTLRQRIIFNEVRNRILEENTDVETNTDALTILLKSKRQYVIVESWTKLLARIKSKIESTNDILLLSDVNQVIGLCNTIDKNSFHPITDGDLSPLIAKNINSYYEVVDKVVDELKNRNNRFTTKGLVKTPQRYGYHRYFLSKNLGLNFSLKLDLWEKFSDTPFWLGISDRKWRFNEELEIRIENLCKINNFTFVPYPNGKGIFIAIKPLMFETEDLVIRDFANKIETIINLLEE